MDTLKKYFWLSNSHNPTPPHTSISSLIDPAKLFNKPEFKGLDKLDDKFDSCAYLSYIE